MQNPYVPVSIDAALALLQAIGATPRLFIHCKIVAGVALLLSQAITELGIPHDGALVIIGAALHDAGKIVHPEELDGPGNAHEPAGETLLLGHGVSPEVARISRTHGSCTSGMKLEELLVGAADSLWKGVRNDRLETLVVEEIARRLHRNHWQVFLDVDPLFERLAAGSDERLVLARVPLTESQTGALS
jgi:hypothetical protein